MAKRHRKILRDPDPVDLQLLHLHWVHNIGAVPISDPNAGPNEHAGAPAALAASLYATAQCVAADETDTKLLAVALAAGRNNADDVPYGAHGGAAGVAGRKRKGAGTSGAAAQGKGTGRSTGTNSTSPAAKRQRTAGSGQTADTAIAIDDEDEDEDADADADEEDTHTGAGAGAGAAAAKPRAAAAAAALAAKSGAAAGGGGGGSGDGNGNGNGLWWDDAALIAQAAEGALRGTVRLGHPYFTRQYHVTPVRFVARTKLMLIGASSWTDVLFEQQTDAAPDFDPHRAPLAAKLRALKAVEEQNESEHDGGGEAYFTVFEFDITDGNGQVMPCVAEVSDYTDGGSDSGIGLSGSVWSRDGTRATQMLAVFEGRQATTTVDAPFAPAQFPNASFAQSRDPDMADPQFAKALAEAKLASEGFPVTSPDAGADVVLRYAPWNSVDQGQGVPKIVRFRDYESGRTGVTDEGEELDAVDDDTDLDAKFVADVSKPSYVRELLHVVAAATHMRFLPRRSVAWRENVPRNAVARFWGALLSRALALARSSAAADSAADSKRPAAAAAAAAAPLACDSVLPTVLCELIGSFMPSEALPHYDPLKRKFT